MCAHTKLEITDELIARVEALAAQGLTYEQIASSLGTSRATLDRRRKDSEQLEAAIKAGKAKGIAKVSNALFKAATNGNITAQIFFLKSQAGWNDRPSESMAETGEVVPVHFDVRDPVKDVRVTNAKPK